MTTHKKHPHDEKSGEAHAAGGGEHKPKRDRAFAINCTLVDDVDDAAADKIRQEVTTYLETYLRKRVGTQLKDLTVE